MLLRIDHETRLSYSQPVTESVIEARTAPPSTEDQTVLAYRLKVTPAAPLTAYRDGFGNRVELFNLLMPHREVVMQATSFVRLHRRAGPLKLSDSRWPLPQPLPVEALEYLMPSPLAGPGPELQAFLAGVAKPDGGTVADAVAALTRAVRGRLRYEKKVTTAHTPVSDVLHHNAGVCQDFAHLFLAAARSWGLPARYVSGYVHAPGEIETHAWVQVWGGPAGWVDTDPTHDKWPETDHVVTAIGRDFADVPPNRGVWKGSADELITVAVKVQEVERVPADFVELTQPAWTGRLARPSRMTQQQIKRGFRQQQSQQQQFRGSPVGDEVPPLRG